MASSKGNWNTGGGGGVGGGRVPGHPCFPSDLNFSASQISLFNTSPTPLELLQPLNHPPPPPQEECPPPIFKILGDDFGSYPIKLSDQPRGQERSVSVLASCVTEGGSPCLSVPAFSPWEPEVRIFPHCQVLRDLGE